MSNLDLDEAEALAKAKARARARARASGGETAVSMPSEIVEPRPIEMPEIPLDVQARSALIPPIPPMNFGGGAGPMPQTPVEPNILEKLWGSTKAAVSPVVPFLKNYLKLTAAPFAGPLVLGAAEALQPAPAGEENQKFGKWNRIARAAFDPTGGAPNPNTEAFSGVSDLGARATGLTPEEVGAFLVTSGMPGAISSFPAGTLTEGLNWGVGRAARGIDPTLQFLNQKTWGLRGKNTLPAISSGEIPFMEAPAASRLQAGITRARGAGDLALLPEAQVGISDFENAVNAGMWERAEAIARGTRIGDSPTAPRLIDAFDKYIAPNVPDFWDPPPLPPKEAVPPAAPGPVAPAPAPVAPPAAVTDPRLAILAGERAAITKAPPAPPPEFAEGPMAVAWSLGYRGGKGEGLPAQERAAFNAAHVELPPPRGPEAGKDFLTPSLALQAWLRGMNPSVTQGPINALAEVEARQRQVDEGFNALTEDQDARAAEAQSARDLAAKAIADAEKAKQDAIEAARVAQEKATEISTDAIPVPTSPRGTGEWARIRAEREARAQALRDQQAQEERPAGMGNVAPAPQLPATVAPAPAVPTIPVPGRPPAPTGTPASADQLSALRSMAKRRKMTEAELASFVQRIFGVDRIESLDQNNAVRAISAVRKWRRTGEEPPPAPPTGGTPAPLPPAPPGGAAPSAPAPAPSVLPKTPEPPVSAAPAVVPPKPKEPPSPAGAAAPLPTAPVVSPAAPVVQPGAAQGASAKAQAPKSEVPEGVGPEMGGKSPEEVAQESFENQERIKGFVDAYKGEEGALLFQGDRARKMDDYYGTLSRSTADPKNPWQVRIFDDGVKLSDELRAEIEESFAEGVELDEERTPGQVSRDTWRFATKEEALSWLAENHVIGYRKNAAETMPELPSKVRRILEEATTEDSKAAPPMTPEEMEESFKGKEPTAKKLRTVVGKTPDGRMIAYQLLKGEELRQWLRETEESGVGDEKVDWALWDQAKEAGVDTAHKVTILWRDEKGQLTGDSSIFPTKEQADKFVELLKQGRSPEGAGAEVDRVEAGEEGVGAEMEPAATEGEPWQMTKDDFAVPGSKEGGMFAASVKGQGPPIGTSFVFTTKDGVSHNATIEGVKSYAEGDSFNIHLDQATYSLLGMGGGQAKDILGLTVQDLIRRGLPLTAIPGREALVRKAVSEGKPVPPEVLAEYGLKPKEAGPSEEEITENLRVAKKIRDESAEAAMWDARPGPEKQKLLRANGLPVGLSRKKWADLSDEQRASVKGIGEGKKEAAPAEPEEVPPSVRNSVKLAIDGLRSIERDLDQAKKTEDFSGERGRYQADVLTKNAEAISQLQARIADFRERAAGKGIDAEKLLSELGGVPDVTPSREAQEWLDNPSGPIVSGGPEKPSPEGAYYFVDPQTGQVELRFKDRAQYAKLPIALKGRIKLKFFWDKQRGSWFSSSDASGNFPSVEAMEKIAQEAGLTARGAKPAAPAAKAAPKKEIPPGQDGSPLVSEKQRPKGTIKELEEAAAKAHENYQRSQWEEGDILARGAQIENQYLEDHGVPKARGRGPREFSKANKYAKIWAGAEAARKSYEDSVAAPLAKARAEIEAARKRRSVARLHVQMAKIAEFGINVGEVFYDPGSMVSGDVPEVYRVTRMDEEGGIEALRGTADLATGEFTWPEGVKALNAIKRFDAHELNAKVRGKEAIDAELQKIRDADTQRTAEETERKDAERRRYIKGADAVDEVAKQTEERVPARTVRQAETAPNGSHGSWVVEVQTESGGIDAVPFPDAASAHAAAVLPEPYVYTASIQTELGYGGFKSPIEVARVKDLRNDPMTPEEASLIAEEKKTEAERQIEQFSKKWGITPADFEAMPVASKTLKELREEMVQPTHAESTGEFGGYRLTIRGDEPMLVSDYNPLKEGLKRRGRNLVITATIDGHPVYGDGNSLVRGEIPSDIRDELMDAPEERQEMVSGWVEEMKKSAEPAEMLAVIHDKEGQRTVFRTPEGKLVTSDAGMVSLIMGVDPNVTWKVGAKGMLALDADGNFVGAAARSDLPENFNPAFFRQLKVPHEDVASLRPALGSIRRPKAVKSLSAPSILTDKFDVKAGPPEKPVFYPEIVPGKEGELILRPGKSKRNQSKFDGLYDLTGRLAEDPDFRNNPVMVVGEDGLTWKAGNVSYSLAIPLSYLRELPGSETINVGDTIRVSRLWFEKVKKFRKSVEGMGETAPKLGTFPTVERTKKGVTLASGLGGLPGMAPGGEPRGPIGKAWDAIAGHVQIGRIHGYARKAGWDIKKNAEHRKEYEDLMETVAPGVRTSKDLTEEQANRFIAALRSKAGLRDINDHIAEVAESELTALRDRGGMSDEEFKLVRDDLAEKLKAMDKPQLLPPDAGDAFANALLGLPQINAMLSPGRFRPVRSPLRVVIQAGGERGIGKQIGHELVQSKRYQDEMNQNALNAIHKIYGLLKPDEIDQFLDARQGVIPLDSVPENVQRAVDMIREFQDGHFEANNWVRVRIGKNPIVPRGDYFSHLENEGSEIVRSAFGEKHTLTETFNRFLRRRRESPNEYRRDAMVVDMIHAMAMIRSIVWDPILNRSTGKLTEWANSGHLETDAVEQIRGIVESMSGRSPEAKRAEHATFKGVSTTVAAPFGKGAIETAMDAGPKFIKDILSGLGSGAITSYMGLNVGMPVRNLTQVSTLSFHVGPRDVLRAGAMLRSPRWRKLMEGRLRPFLSGSFFVKTTPEEVGLGKQRVSQAAATGLLAGLAATPWGAVPTAMAALAGAFTGALFPRATKTAMRAANMMMSLSEYALRTPAGHILTAKHFAAAAKANKDRNLGLTEDQLMDHALNEAYTDVAETLFMFNELDSPPLLTGRIMKGLTSLTVRYPISLLQLALRHGVVQGAIGAHIGQALLGLPGAIVGYGLGVLSSPKARSGVFPKVSFDRDITAMAVAAAKARLSDAPEQGVDTEPKPDQIDPDEYEQARDEEYERIWQQVRDAEDPRLRRNFWTLVTPLMAVSVIYALEELFKKITGRTLGDVSDPKQVIPGPAGALPLALAKAADLYDRTGEFDLINNVLAPTVERRMLQSRRARKQGYWTDAYGNPIRAKVGETPEGVPIYEDLPVDTQTRVGVILGLDTTQMANFKRWTRETVKLNRDADGLRRAAISEFVRVVNLHKNDQATEEEVDKAFNYILLRQKLFGTDEKLRIEDLLGAEKAAQAFKLGSGDTRMGSSKLRYPGTVKDLSAKLPPILNELLGNEESLPETSEEELQKKVGVLTEADKEKAVAAILYSDAIYAANLRDMFRYGRIMGLKPTSIRSTWRSALKARKTRDIIREAGEGK